VSVSVLAKALGGRGQRLALWVAKKAMRIRLLCQGVMSGRRYSEKGLEKSTKTVDNCVCIVGAVSSKGHEMGLEDKLFIFSP
jgi:hypothetical protein